jgi:histidinol-phosphate phosphatase family protein
MALKKAVFIDKDGTLIEDVPFNVDPEKIRLMPGAERALSCLRYHGFELFVISNQSGVAAGRFKAHELLGVEQKISELLRSSGVAIQKFYWCRHARDSTCVCRKPSPGLLFRAAVENGIDLKRSWMVGDILHDVEAGHRAGCRAILIENGNETEWEFSPLRFPDLMSASLEEAAREIISLAMAEEKGTQYEFLQKS